MVFLELPRNCLLQTGCFYSNNNRFSSITEKYKGFVFFGDLGKNTNPGWSSTIYMIQIETGSDVFFRKTIKSKVWHH